MASPSDNGCHGEASVALAVDECSGTVIAMALTSQPERTGFPLTLELNY